MNGEGRRGAGGKAQERIARGARRSSFFFLLCGSLLFLVFAPNALGAGPTITSISVTEVTTSSATLRATLNPEGLASTYRFEYGLEPCETSSCTKTATGPAGSGNSPVPVSATVEGLGPGVTYHFRVVANSTGGISKGPDTTLTPYRLPQAFGPCSNDIFRDQQPSATLPDCRAYEQSSPVQKNALDARGTVDFVKASPAGDGISFVTAGGAPGAEGSQELPVYLSSRGAGNWSTQGVLPPTGKGEGQGDEAFILGWTPDFAQVFDAARRFGGAGGTSLLSRPSDGGEIASIVPYGGGLGAQPPAYADASADGSEVLFESTFKLTALPEALEGSPNLYLWNRDTGKVSLAGIFNDETSPPAGAMAGPYDWIKGTNTETLSKGGAGGASLTVPYYTQDEHVISADGSKVYFTAAGSGQLYLRKNPARPQSEMEGEKCLKPADACTIRISASKRTIPDPVGTRPAAFMEASPDGSKAFFTSSEELTNDANTGPERPGPSIGRVNLDGEAGKELGFIPTRAKGLAVGGGFLYWASPETGAIGRAKLNGSGAASEVQSEFIVKKESPAVKGPTNPQGIAVDAGHIYWANAGEEFETKTIARANLDGSGVEGAFVQIGTELLAETPRGLAVNSTHIFLTTTGSGGHTFVVRIDLGDKSESFFESGDGAEPRGIALDAGHLYWARQGANTLARANLDLGEKNLEYVKGASAPIGAAVDGEHIYWSANQETPPNPGNDLYRYDANAGSLADVAPDPTEEDGARVLGVLGSSADGSVVYFAANGDLDGTGPAQEGDCEGKVSDTFVNFSGQCSLYVSEEGATKPAFIARLDATEDATNWLPHGNVIPQAQRTARVTPDGQTLLFRTQAKLTSYENEGIFELYRYRLGSGGIGCVSCDPSGEAPTGGPGFGSITLSALTPAEFSYTLSRNLSADGNRVFFETTDSLVGEDTNGEAGCPVIGPAQGRYRSCLDAYEWEAKGTGSCTEDVQGGGCLYLLSSGKSTDSSYIADASTTGDDVFLITRSPFVRQDQDQLYDVYDAHVGGGLASQNQVKSTCESAEACHSAPTPPPSFTSPGTASFSGPPNPKPKQAKKPQRKHKKQKKHKKHKKRGAKHRAQASGRAGR